MNISLSPSRYHQGALYRQPSATMSTAVACAAPDRGPPPGHLEECFARWLESHGGGGAWAPDPSAWLIGSCPGQFPTAPAEWLAALAALSLTLVRDIPGRGQVVPLPGAGPDRLVVLPWRRRATARQGLEWAARWVRHWWSSSAVDPSAALFADKFLHWLEQAQSGGLSPNNSRFALAALERDIPVQVVAENVIRLGWGCAQRRLDGAFTGETSQIASSLAKNKATANRVLAEGGVPVPRMATIRSLEDARAFARSVGWPVVLKPARLDQGIGVVPGIGDDEDLARAFETVRRYAKAGLLAEEHVAGEDYRLLVIGGTLRLAALRRPAGIVGDGRASVAALVAAANADPRRQGRTRSLLVPLTLDGDEARFLLAEQGLTAESVPEAGRFVRLRRTANVSQGGTAEDATDIIHPDNRKLAERAARLIGLDICGVDFLCPDITRSWREVGGWVVEVNAQPGFFVTWLAVPRRNLNGETLDWLFADRSARIPTAAVTGTNGKTTTCRMLHRIWGAAGRRAGVATTQGVWVGEDNVSGRNLSGLPGAAMLLADPATEAAVIEMPRKALAVFGHPCDRYDVAALLNVQDDHLGELAVNSLEAMAQVKLDVLRRAREAVVVNADDPLCLAAAAHAGCRRIILAAQSEAPVRAHLARGGEAVFLDSCDGREMVVMAQGLERRPLMGTHEIGAACGGVLRHNIANALFATALALGHGLPPAAIRAGLAAFTTSYRDNPGRGNTFDGFAFQLWLDYAHNPDGLKAIAAAVGRQPVAGVRRAVVANLGNRHRSHLAAVAATLAGAFDHLILSCDPTRLSANVEYGRDDPQAVMLAAFRRAVLTAGMPAGRVSVEPDPVQAVRRGMAEAEAGDLLVLLAEAAVALPVIEAGGAGMAGIEAGCAGMAVIEAGCAGMADVAADAV